MKKFILSLIRAYQRFLSLDTGILTPVIPSCRFTPTCSEYTYQAISKYGILPGVWLGLKRFLRCQPWSQPGTDPLL